VRRDRTNSGTGLVEVLVAAALALVLVVGTAEMMALALRAKRRGDLAATTRHALAVRFEELKSRPFDDPALAPGDYAQAVRVEPSGCLISETWHITDDGRGLKRVRLAAREAGGAGPETVAVLLISRDVGFRP
jgi:Tfp pilus assembly protein PilV